MVDANLRALKFAIRKVSIFNLDLLVGSPKIEMIWRRRIDEKECYGYDGNGDPELIAPAGLQQRHPRQNDGEPYRRWQSHPRYGKECEDAGQTAGQIPGIAVKRAWRELNLAADGLPYGDEDVGNEQEQDGGDRR